MKLEFFELCVEITRRCNMNCAHCLRGDAENLDMPFEKLKSLLDVTDYIDSLVFTGGEPALNVSFMRKTLEYVKEKEIPVTGLFIATNGKEVTEEFLLTWIQWFAYCLECGEERDLINIALSKDDFHERIPDRNRYLIEALPGYTDIKQTDFRKTAIIRSGRAAKNSAALKKLGFSFRDRTPATVCNVARFGDAFRLGDTVYLSAKGDICVDCDLAYKDQEKHAVGNVDDLPSFFAAIEKADKDGELRSA